MGCSVKSGMKSRMKRGMRRSVLAFMLALLAQPGMAQPKTTGSDIPEQSRILSLNMCTDQLLVDLVPRSRIVGLSPYARDAQHSWARDRIDPALVMSGTAEEALRLRPDLVVMGLYDKPATRALVETHGLRVADFDDVKTIAEARAQIHRFGVLTNSEVAAAARIAEIDAALAELRGAARGRALSVLPYARRGWVSGRDTLMSDLLREAGLFSAASALGIGYGGFVRLEQVVALKPDAMLLAEEPGKAEDQGVAMLAHPVLDRLFPPERRLIVPERFTVCGGAMLAEAMRQLARQITKLKPRNQ